MSAKPVNPVNGKYTIPGKDNRNLELTLDDSDLKKYIVEDLDGEDMAAKLPASNPQNINWFACFSIYNSKDDKKNGYAHVKYSFTVRLDEGQRLFVAYGGEAHEVTDEIKKNGKVTLTEGDPPTGTIP
jgi:hypothetical protein